jgi:predicted histidine transporter YuiF (NhaC family)
MYTISMTIDFTSWYLIPVCIYLIPAILGCLLTIFDSCSHDKALAYAVSILWPVVLVLFAIHSIKRRGA